MSTETQKHQIKAALDMGERLTALDALNAYGCMRLGARIHELRKEGYPIEAVMVRTYSGKYVKEYRRA